MSSTRKTHIPSLTPLRGIAALLVVVFHVEALVMMMQLGSIAPGTGFVLHGHLWVDFFFILSGFIITHVYGEWFAEGVARPQVRAYLIARFSRLYPLHFFALCLTVLLYIGVYSRMPTPAGGGAGSGSGMAQIYEWKALPFHYLLLLGFGLTGMTWNVPAWSIATEWWTYLLALPLFRTLNRGVSLRTYLVPIGCALGLLGLAFTNPYRSIAVTFDFGIVRCFLDFVMGICLYQGYRARAGERWLATDGALLIVTLLVIVCLHFPVPQIGAFTSPESFKPNLWNPLFELSCLFAFAGLILCAAFNVSRGYRVLNAKPLQYLGDISYSIYLMQGISFLFFMISAGIWRQKHPTGPMDTFTILTLLFATLLFDILIASMTYRWIEVPAREWLRKKARRGERTVSETEPAVSMGK